MVDCGRGINVMAGWVDFGKLNTGPRSYSVLYATAPPTLRTSGWL